MFNYKEEFLDFCVLLHNNCKRWMIVWGILGCFLFFIRYVFLFLENCFANFLVDTLMIIDRKKLYGMCFFAACHFKIFLGSFFDAFLSFLCDVQYFFLTFCTDILGLTQTIKKRRKMYGLQPSPWGHFEVCIFMYFCAHFGYTLPCLEKLKIFSRFMVLFTECLRITLMVTN